jgi:hypothetical protein
MPSPGAAVLLIVGSGELLYTIQDSASLLPTFYLGQSAVKDLLANQDSLSSAHVRIPKLSVGSLVMQQVFVMFCAFPPAAYACAISQASAYANGRQQKVSLVRRTDDWNPGVDFRPPLPPDHDDKTDVWWQSSLVSIDQHLGH